MIIFGCIWQRAQPIFLHLLIMISCPLWTDKLRNMIIETLPKIVHNISVALKNKQEAESIDGNSDDDSLDNDGLYV